jgi:histidyl-tRNA synthetase
VPDAKCVKIVSEALESLAFRKYGVEYEVKVNHRALLDGVFAICGVSADRFRQICSAVDKLDKSPWDQVREEMLEKGLSEEKADKLGRFVSNDVFKRDLSAIEKLCRELATSETSAGHDQCEAGVAALRKLFEFVKLMHVPMENVKFDMSMARGLDYYTGVIFEVILKRNGKVFEVGSVAGGGRYDNLVGMFSKKKNKQVPCVGISLGIERLITVLDELKKASQEEAPSDLDVFVGAIDAGGFESLPHRMSVCAQLWDAGLRAEFWHKKKVSKPTEQFEHCEKERIPIMVYFGSSEWRNGDLRVRRMFHDQPKTADGFVVKEEVVCSNDNLLTEIKRLLEKA